MAADKTPNFWSVDAGLYVTELEERLSTQGGDASVLTGAARLRRGWHLGRGIFFEPSLGAVFPWKSGVDGNVRQYTFLVGLDFGYAPWSFLRLRGGPGMHWMIVDSTEQTVSLQNGTGTSDFYIPGAFRHGFIFTANAGLELLFFQRVSLVADLYLLNPASADRRRLYASLLVGVRL